MLAGIGRRDSVVALLVTLAAAGIAYTGYADRYVGVALLVALVVYIVWRYRHPPAKAEVEAEETTAPPNFLLSLVFFVAGVAALVFGGGWLVTGAIEIASDLGVSETVIGLTIVAVGTSLPELAASAVAAFRGHAELALGNVLGSNIYNVFFIGGVTGAIAPTPVPETLVRFDLPILIGVSLAVMALAWTGARLSRWEGAALVAAYCAYLGFTAGLF